MSDSIAEAMPITTTDGMVLSLWLLPPKVTRDLLKEQIDKFADNGTKGPIFEPHVTLVAPIPCQSMNHALEIAETLKTGLSGFGKIPCAISDVPYSSKGVWSQALFFTIEMSAPLMNLCQKARALIGMDTENWQFASPATYPHLSLYYGTENIPEKSQVQAVKAFYSNTISLVLTDPPTLEGVTKWKEIASISL